MTVNDRAEKPSIRTFMPNRRTCLVDFLAWQIQKVETKAQPVEHFIRMIKNEK
jgi:hypothetical protein